MILYALLIITFGIAEGIVASFPLKLLSMWLNHTMSLIFVVVYLFVCLFSHFYPSKWQLHVVQTVVYDKIISYIHGRMPVFSGLRIQVLNIPVCIHSIGSLIMEIECTLLIVTLAPFFLFSSVLTSVIWIC